MPLLSCKSLPPYYTITIYLWPSFFPPEVVAVIRNFHKVSMLTMVTSLYAHITSQRTLPENKMPHANILCMPVPCFFELIQLRHVLAEAEVSHLDLLIYSTFANFFSLCYAECSYFARYFTA